MPPDSSPAPSSQKSVFPVEEDDAGWNGLSLELAPFGLERLDDYAPGGQHPIHLGDLLGPGRRGPYRVLHKLGSGDCANVWLCRDVAAETSTQYVALKVLASNESTEDCQERRAGQQLQHSVENSGGQDAADYLCLPLDEFEIGGPNGTHLCLVYPVLGSTVAQGAFRRSPNLDGILRNAGRQTAIAVDILHKQGICHGDITPSNILHRISGLDGLSEDEVLEVVGTPNRNAVLQEGAPHELPSAPQYLVYPVKWTQVDIKFIEPDSCLIDLGQSFNVSRPPDGDDLGTPGPYRSPELILDKAAGVGSDLWALGCTLFEIRTGRKLFGLFDDDDDSYLDAMVQVFGRLPEPWWSTTWEARRRMYKDESDESGRAVAAVAVQETPEEYREDGVEVISRTHPSVAQDVRSIREMLGPGLWYLGGKDSGGEYHEDIPESEKEAIADLVGRLLAYDPTVRPQGQDLINHRWFSC